MDPKILYWTGATLNMLVLIGFGGAGVHFIRRGDVVRHRRCMLTAGALVVAFLLSYLVKLALLGREDFGTWSSISVSTLRFHETCILIMLIGGTSALTRAWRMRVTRNVTRNKEDPPADASTLRWHRRSGWTALLGGLVGLLAAVFVLGGMYERFAQ